MIRKVMLAILLSCVFAVSAYADENGATPHTFDDLDDNGVSDSAQRAELNDGSTAPSTETEDADQSDYNPVDSDDQS